MCHDEVAPYGEGSREELIALQTRLVKSPFQLSDSLFEILDLVGRRFFSVNTPTRSGLPRDVFWRNNRLTRFESSAQGLSAVGANGFCSSGQTNATVWALRVHGAP